MNKIFDFNNIGKKIKSLTRWMCWMLIALWWTFLLVMIVISVSNDAELGIKTLVLWIVSAVFVPLMIWIGNWMVYAFGDLVDNVNRLRKQFCPEEKRTFLCPCCGKEVVFGEKKCSHCGQSFEWEE